MHAPSWTCEALYDLHKQLRLAWSGSDNKFAIVQPFHISDCGTYDEPKRIAIEFWDVTIDPSAVYDECYDMKKVDRGPIFNKHGDTRRDWDGYFRRPIFVTTIEPQDVFNGRFLVDTKRNLISMKQRYVDSAKAKGRGLKHKVDTISSEMTNDLWKMANKSDATTQIASAEQQAYAQKRLARERPDYENMFIPKNWK